MSIFIRFIFLFIGIQWLEAQSITVGTLLNKAESFDGYTLFSPMGNLNTYLVDNCGRTINRWESSYTAGLSAYLHTDGQLYRSARINGPFTVSGQGGRMERFDWNGNLTWSYNYNGINYSPHHDFCVLPNGNVVLIVVEKKTRQEALAAGRDSIVFTDSELYPEYLVELEPIGVDSARIVWEWHVWDHLVQNFDSTLQNYGQPADKSERIDINFTDGFGTIDWLHANSVDYNPTLDQLVISIRHLSEIWVIDHSTSIAQAASSSGGRYAMGGDILYRWGNPQAYGAGSPSDRIFGGQHGVRWLGNNSLMVYNNNPQRGYSSVDAINIPIDSAGFYQRPTASSAFLPNQLSWTYTIDTLFSSGRLSGAQRLDNGNTLISSGIMGYIFEINAQDSVVWAYRNPVGPNGIAAQGTIPIGGSNEIFNAIRYSPSYAGLIGQNIQVGNPIELNFDISQCQLYNAVADTDSSSTTHLFPNPCNNYIQIESSIPIKLVVIYDAQGRKVWEEQTNGNGSKTIHTETLPNGIYLLFIDGYSPQKFVVMR